MSHNNIESKVETLIEPIIHELEYDLYDVQYVKEGKDYYLRIIIDNLKGITIEDCERVNNAIDEILDEADFINTSYFLEVSSTEIEKILSKPRNYEKQIGNKIYVKLFKAKNKQKEIEGILKEYNKEEIQLEKENETIKIEVKNIAMAKTIADIF